MGTLRKQNQTLNLLFALPGLLAAQHQAGTGNIMVTNSANKHMFAGGRSSGYGDPRFFPQRKKYRFIHRTTFNKNR